MTQPYTKSINGFEVEFDCSEEELETLEDKLSLITLGDSNDFLSLGNGKDLCIVSDDFKTGGYKAAKLKVRHYNNVDRNKLKNGGIEIESDCEGVIANNCCWVYHSFGEVTLHLVYPEKQLLVRIVYEIDNE